MLAADCAVVLIVLFISMLGLCYLTFLLLACSLFDLVFCMLLCFWFGLGTCGLGFACFTMSVVWWGLVCWICVAELLGVYFYFEFGLRFWFGCLWSVIDG